MDQPRTLRDKAAQLLFVRIGSNMPPAVTVAEDMDRIAALLERCPVGGLVLFNGTVAETPTALANLQRRSRYPLLIGSDMERGVGQQVRGATVFPHAMAYAGMGGQAPARVKASARVSAREALACGIHITFSPCADVNSDPRNPIIATRAFGTTAAGVAPLVEAYIEGCRAEGLFATAKHYPGHGNTSTDSHDALPVVESPRTVLDQTDLPPFARAVAAGVDFVMTAHVAFPALDPSGLPATASRPILYGVLREEMRFEGVVVTDSLLMSGIKGIHDDAGAQAVALLQAGVDVLLDIAEPEAALRGILAAVDDGRLSAARVEEAFRRVWACKTVLLERFGPEVFIDPPVPAAEIHTTEARRLAATVAQEAVMLKAQPGVLPWRPDAAAQGGVMAVLLKPNRTRMDPPEEPLGAAVRAAFPGASYHEMGPEAPAEAYEALLDKATTVKHLLVAMIVKPAAWHRFGLLPDQQRFVEAVTARQPAVVASLGIPYILASFPNAAASVCTFSDVAVSQEALVAVLGA